MYIRLSVCKFMYVCLTYLCVSSLTTTLFFLLLKTDKTTYIRSLLMYTVSIPFHFTIKWTQETLLVCRHFPKIYMAFHHIKQLILIKKYFFFFCLNVPLNAFKWLLDNAIQFGNFWKRFRYACSALLSTTGFWWFLFSCFL